MKIRCASHTAILEYLIALGKEAERLLAKEKPGRKRNWNSLYREFIEAGERPVSETSGVDYRRWLARISGWAEQNGIVSPEDLSREAASDALKTLYEDKASAPRVCRFYRRVWKTLGMDDDVWTLRDTPDRVGKEYYRRLTSDEVGKLLRFLKQRSPEHHDMVVIAYYTGLRLSDVAELELSELSENRCELRIIPNKVKTRRIRKLVIPLVREAKSIVGRRAKEAFPDGGLFTPNARKRPSRKISAAFRSCRIKKVGCGRASFHSLRSTFISLMDEAGILPYVTDAITGHCAGDMHARYSQPSSDVLKRAILKAVPPLILDTASEPWQIGRVIRPDPAGNAVATHKQGKKK